MMVPQQSSSRRHRLSTPSSSKTTSTTTVMLTVLLVQLLVTVTPAAAFTVHVPQPLPSSSSSLTQLGLARGPPRGRRPPPRVQEVKPVMNQEIPAGDLRVMVASVEGGSKDEPLGILSKAQALQKARELGNLDVILINDKASPPVCKIVDYSKYRYMQEKKAKELKKNSKATEVKEVKMSYKIDVHDYQVRKKNTMKFIQQGNRVKCTVVFRGREVQHDKLGYELLGKLAEDLTDLCIAENKPKREGRNLAQIFTPRVEVMKAISDGRRAEEKAKKRRKAQQLEQRKARAQAVNNSNNKQTPAAKNKNNDADDELAALLGSDELTQDLFK